MKLTLANGIILSLLTGIIISFMVRIAGDYTRDTALIMGTITFMFVYNYVLKLTIFKEID